MPVELGLVIALLVAQIALLIALGAFIIQHAGYAYSSGLDVPFVPTPKKYYPAIVEALQIEPGDVVYDLGSGSGIFLVHCAKLFPQTRFIGIERNPFLHMQSQWRKRSAGNPANLEFRRENFFTADMRDATKMYGYLLSRINTALFPHGTQRGVRYVSRAFLIEGRTPVATIELSPRKGFHGEHLLHVYEL